MLKDIEKARACSRDFHLRNRERRLIAQKKRYLETRSYVLAKQAEYRKNNPEKIKLKNEKYYWRLHAKHLLKSERRRLEQRPIDIFWRIKNKEKLYAATKKWLKTPSGIFSRKAIDHKRREKTEKLSKAFIQIVYERNIKQHGRLTCYICLIPISLEKSELEHKIPLTPRNKLITPGTNHIDNLDVACRSCNAKKHNMTLEEYFARTANSYHPV